MINRRKRILFMILILALCGVAGAYGQDIFKQPTGPTEPRSLTGLIKWKKQMGVLPSAPNSDAPSDNICSQFYVAVTLATDPSQAIVASDNGLVVKRKEDPNYYYCGFKMTVPSNRYIRVQAVMGGVSHLAKPDRLPFHYTRPWIANDGGDQAVPPRGFIRSFAPPNKIVLLGVKGMYLSFEIMYTPKP